MSGNLPPPALPPPPPLPSAPIGAPRRRTNGMAIASLCCSAASFLTGVTWVLGIIFGHIALGQINRDPEQTGRGLAIAGPSDRVFHTHPFRPWCVSHGHRCLATIEQIDVRDAQWRSANVTRAAKRSSMVPAFIATCQSRRTCLGCPGVGAPKSGPIGRIVNFDESGGGFERQRGRWRTQMRRWRGAGRWGAVRRLAHIPQFELHRGTAQNESAARAMSSSALVQVVSGRSRPLPGHGNASTGSGHVGYDDLGGIRPGIRQNPAQMGTAVRPRRSRLRRRRSWRRGSPG